MITAHDLSLVYAQAVSAYWRGEGDALRELGTWLARFWADGPPEPSSHPVAVCPHGAGGRGIRWYEIGPAVLGYVPGEHGCYQVPRTAGLPINADRRDDVAVVRGIAA